MKFRNVIFDLDGTLLDTTEGVVESAGYAAREMGYPEAPKEELQKFIGPPIQQSFMSYYGADEKQAQEAAEIFREYYKTKALLKAVPYEGIYELCEQFKRRGIRMAVATYKREDYARTLLEYYHFDTYCSPIYGADNHNKLKKEDIVERCMKDMKGTKDDTVLIGDTKGDGAAAEKKGISFLGVPYGFGFQTPEDVNEYPNIGTADSPLKIADMILNI